MKLAQDDLVAALRLRYDHYSAQTMFEVACKQANLADQATYDRAEITAFRSALARVGDRLQAVDERLDHLLGTSGEAAAPAPTASPAPVAEPAPAPIAAPAPAAPVGVPAVATVPVVAPEPPHAVPAPASTRSSKSGKSRARTASDAAHETKIVLRGVVLEEGDEVLVCGDRDELGNWDPELACPMAREGDRWYATVTIPPGTKGSFKFLRRTSTGELVWEGGDDRRLEAIPQIDATWQ